MFLVLLLLLPEVQGSTWTQIFACDSRKPQDKRVLFSNDIIVSMAKDSHRVRICTDTEKGASERDCVTSKKDTFPIKNLQDGNFLLSHPPTDLYRGICDAACVDEVWETKSRARATNMQVICGRKDGDDSGSNMGNYHTTTNFYHACGNHMGMHFQLDDGDLCGWAYRQGSKLAVYVDDGIETTSTTTTTTHKLEPTIDELEAKVGKLEFQVKTMATELGEARQETLDNAVGVESNSEAIFGLASAASVANMTVAMAGMATTLQATQEALATLSAESKTQIKDLTAKVESSAAVIAALKAIAASVGDAAPAGVLGSAGSLCSGGRDCAPSISTDGDDVLFASSKGSVKIDTKDCGKVDVCTVAKALDAIKKGLDLL